mgnify:CR=1 FL=1
MSIRSDEQNIICARNRTIKDLKTQLAEKDREIERLNKGVIEAMDCLDCDSIAYIILTELTETNQ